MNRARKHQLLLAGLSTGTGILLIGGFAAGCQMQSEPASDPDPASSSSASSTPDSPPEESADSSPESSSSSSAEASASGSAENPLEAADYNLDPDSDRYVLGASEPKDHCFTDDHALAVEAIRVMSTWDAANDFNQTTATVRAKYLMHPDRAETTVETKRPAGTEWNAPAKNAALSLTEIEPVTGTDSQSMQYTAQSRWAANDGWDASGINRYWSVTVTDDPDRDGCRVINDYTWQSQ